MCTFRKGCQGSGKKLQGQSRLFRGLEGAEQIVIRVKQRESREQASFSAFLIPFAPLVPVMRCDFALLRSSCKGGRCDKPSPLLTESEVEMQTRQHSKGRMKFSSPLVASFAILPFSATQRDQRAVIECDSEAPHHLAMLKWSAVPQVTVSPHFCCSLALLSHSCLGACPILKTSLDPCF